MSRETRNDDLNFRFEKVPGIHEFEQHFERILLLERRSVRNERLSERRTHEERIIRDWRSNRAAILKRSRNKLPFREEQDRRLFDPNRIFVSRNREQSRVKRGQDFRRTDRKIFSESRISEFQSSVSNVIDVWYHKMKENSVVIFLSIVFLLDFVNEVLRVRK